MSSIGITRAETQINNKSSTGAEGYFIQSDGSVAMDEILRMDDNKIIQLADPVDPQDAVNLRTLQNFDVSVGVLDIEITTLGNFTVLLPHTPRENSLVVLVNGVAIRPGINGYTLSGNLVTVTGPVRVEDLVTLIYKYVD